MSTTKRVDFQRIRKPLPSNAIRCHTGGMFGEKFDSAIGGLRLSQADAARILGMSEQVISKWINGKGTPKFSALKTIAERLPIDLNWLIDDRLDDSPPRYREDRLTSAAGYARVVGSRDETAHDAELVRQAKRQKKRADVPSAERITKGSGSTRPRPGSRPDQGELEHPIAASQKKRPPKRKG
jgi:transcriptional regulator with XRE-family HTH domain